jgi:hypothetical protein
VDNSVLSVGDEPRANSDGTPSQGQEETLAQLTQLLSEAFTARGLIQLQRGELDLARADLDQAVVQVPDNTEAHRLRILVEERQQHDHRSETLKIHPERLEQARSYAGPPETQFQAGYLVTARYPKCPDYHEPLGSPSPLTPQGRLHAIEFARRMCSEESSTQRQQLYDASWTGGEWFDTVVWEFRSLARVIHFEKGTDPYDEPLEANHGE